MKRRFSLNTKLIVYILSVSVAIYIAAIGFNSIRTRKANYRDATRLADSYAAQYANLSKVSLNSFMFSTNTVVDVFENYREIPEPIRRKLFADVLKIILRSNPDYLSVWSIWEPNSLDGFDQQYKNTVGSTILGNFRHVYYKEGSQIKLSQYVEQDSSQVLSGKVYNEVKTKIHEIIIDPYYYSYTGLDKDKVLEANLVAPIMANGKFSGIVGIDVPLGNFQKMIDYIHPFEESYGILVSNNGTIVAHPNGELIGQNLASLNRADDEKYGFSKKIREGQRFSFTGNNPDGSEYYITFHPIEIGQTATPWTLGIVVPVNIIMREANHNFYISLGVGTLGLVLLTLVVLFIARNITRPVIITTRVLKDLSLGNFNIGQKLQFETNDEVGDMAHSVNQVIEGLHQTAQFAREIGKGNLDAEFKLLSDGDVLGNSLLEMRKSLKHAEEEEKKRKAEDERQRWASEGLSKINDILRENNKLGELSFKLTSYLVDFTASAQGGFYAISQRQDKQVELELVCTIAYGRHRLIDKNILPGEGMVGRCFLEKQTIYMTEIPDDYAQISSGLGGAKPSCLLIVPLKINEMVMGVVELLSFKNFETYQIAFVERAGEAIASAISMARINEQTERLLYQSQIQADELAQKEEELRQNLEEMAATQEEAGSREQMLREVFDAINEIALIAEFDMDGKITSINDDFLDLLGMSRDLVIGQEQGFLDAKSDEKRKTLWNNLRKGLTQKGSSQLKVGNRMVQLTEVYKPIADKNGDPYKVLKIAFNISENI